MRLAHAPNSSSPLSREQAELLERLATTLSPEQALWASGYLAGVRGAPTAWPASADEAMAPVTVLYGSETGNAEALAEQARHRAKERGLAVRVIDMADYKARELKDKRLLLVVTATHGEGDPPGPAEDFFEFVHGRKAPKLAGTKFAVLALGDSSYEHFCQAGKDLDARLEALGAERLLERADCDVDYEGSASAWIDRALDAFAPHVEAPPSRNVVTFGRPASREAPTYDKDHPLRAELLDNLILNGRGSDKETRHIELSIEGSGLSFEPGDVLCVVPQNGAETVAALVAALGLDPGERVTMRGEEMSLEEALLGECEITQVTPPFAQAYARLTDSAELADLVAEHNRTRLMAYARTRQVLDVVLEHPPRSVSAQAVVDMLRPLQPREYSIASSPNTNPDEIHLTVAVERQHTIRGYREGAASTHLADRVRPGNTVPVYVKRNKNFKLPDDADAPVIMVGPGTGVAPFRAFLEERGYGGAGGPSWLFFGDRHFRTDFLYQIEWQQRLKEGVLDRIDVAFSRDGPRKVYVQDRMRERGRELYEWLEAGAHLYVCGDAKRMAPDVHQTLIEIIQREGGRSAEEAGEHVKELQRERRYQRDIY